MSAPSDRRGAGRAGHLVAARWPPGCRARRLARSRPPRRAPSATSPTPRRCGRCSPARGPTVVFNAAAYTDVDGAETRARPAPTRSTRRAPRRSRRRPPPSARAVVHYSTDFVFDGDARAPLRRARSAVAAGALRASEGGGRPAGRGRQPAALHPARRLPVRARRPQLPLDRSCAACARARRSAPTASAWRRRPGCARSPLSRPRWPRTRAPRPVPLHRAGRDHAGPTSPAWPPSLVGVARRARPGGRDAELPLKAPRPRRAILGQPGAARARTRHAVALAGRAARVRRGRDAFGIASRGLARG